MKLCPRCNTNKPLSDFYSHSNKCKECIKWQKRKDYHNDLENARLESRMNWQKHSLKQWKDRYAD